MAEKVISSLNISINAVPAAGEVRQFTVSGELDAVFLMQIVNSDGSFYDFTTQEFSGGVGSGMNTFSINNTLRVKMNSTIYGGSIYLPADTTTYNVLFMPDPTGDTRLASRQQVVNKSFTQGSNSTITFAVSTATSDYSSDPPGTNVTTVGSSALATSTSVTANYTVTNASTDANGFGLILSRSPISKYYYFTTTEAVGDNPAGDGEDSTIVTVADLTDIGIGMKLHFHKATTVPTNKAGSAVGTTTITAINTTTKTITFSKAVAFEDTETMTFRATGLSTINSVLDCDIESSSIAAFTGLTPVTTTVRGAVGGSTTVTVNGTYGIAGGSLVTFTGTNVNNVTTNDVNVVTASSSAGQFTCDVAQTFKGGEVLTFVGSSSTINIESVLIINRYPAVNRTIYLDLDGFITPGVSGA